MSGNARGQLKEQAEGIAKNLIWIGVHCDKALEILGEIHPELQEYFQGVKQAVDTLNDLHAGVYSKL